MSAADAAVFDGIGAQINVALQQLQQAGSMLGGSQDATVAPAGGMIASAAQMLDQSFNQMIAGVKKLAEAAP